MNPKKTTLYIGVTNKLSRRLQEHYDNRGNPNYFAGRYHCYNLVYYEEFKYVLDAIAREKQLKNWSRKKKDWLIEMKNPRWEILNASLRANKNFSTPSHK
jgi:putative endonuclease